MAKDWKRIWINHIFLKERVRMKRFVGMVLLLFLATMAIAGCYGSGGGCPQGVCDEAHSPGPDKAAEAPAGEEAPAQ